MAAKSTKKKRPKRNEAHIPMWWMQVTPHNTLDMEDEHTRRLFEEKMALWYAEQAAQEAESGEGLMLDIDGNPLSPEEAERVQQTGHGGWKSEWGSNTNETSGNDKPHSILFGGRNFQPGSPGWNPRQWGIDSSDPDFDLYQSGEKLPQEYIDAMNNYAKATGKYQSPDYGSGLRSTEGGYGELGAKPTHVPFWMKKKLRSTNQGASIRQGQYDDSPNKHLKPGYERRVPGDGDDGSPRNFLHAPTPTAANTTTASPENEDHDDEDDDDDDEDSDAGAAVGHVAPEPKTFASHKDYYYNSTTPEAGTKATSNGLPDPEEDNGGDDDDDDDDDDDNDDESYEEVEEVVVETDDEEFEEFEVQDEEEMDTAEQLHIQDEVVEQDASLEDLQATLAAKMAELKKLQGA